MKKLHKSVLIWYSPEEMFRLVTDVDAYPQFLPWCDHARVLETTEQGMTAEIGLKMAGIKQAFTTRNTHVPGREVQMQLVDGKSLPYFDASIRLCISLQMLTWPLS